MQKGLMGLDYQESQWFVPDLQVHRNHYYSAYYIRVYVEWFANGLERAKGGRENCSLSQLAAYMP
ncbi:hypothetical protein GEN90_02330 [Vibrio parahaemolyticus]|nr:hypothetical protein [Vibrio parahaemolyticus]